MANDYAACWLIHEIGTLDEVSFITSAASICADSFSVCLWLDARRLDGIQIIAQQGRNDANGWLIRLDDGQIIFEVIINQQTVVHLIQPFPTSDGWRHIAGIVDYESQFARFVVDDSEISAPIHIQPEDTPATSELIIGGYTDPAGGHFDHTFGRNQSGWVDDVRLYARALSPAEISALSAKDGTPPVANFTVQAESDSAPTRVHFQAVGTETTPSPLNPLSHKGRGDFKTAPNAATPLSTGGREAGGEGETAEDEAIHVCLWDFGDRASAIGTRVEHSYPYAGTYSVRLTVVNDRHQTASMEQVVTLGGEPNPLKFTPVFVNSTEGYACFRIPSIVRAANGDLVAFAEARLESCSDSTDTIRIVCKRSRDNGGTWLPVQVVAQNIGDGQEYVTVNCSPVVDTVHGTGCIIVLYNKAEYSEWDMARGIGLSRICCIFSDDNGETWHGEHDVTSQVHRPFNLAYQDIYPYAADEKNRHADWRIQRPSIGHGLQLRSGRIFHAGTFTAGDRSVFQSQNYAFWSDDLGETWTIGASIPHIGLNEAMAVELENGDILFNSRGYIDEHPAGRRAVTVGHWESDDILEFSPTRFDDALIDPAVQASILRYPDNGILFANPNHAKGRYNLTIRLSDDEGKTWTHSKTIDPGPSAYSDLVIQRDGRIGVLYEQGNQGGVTYVNFTLDWLTDGADSIEEKL